jgi:hypothetical protein
MHLLLTGYCCCCRSCPIRGQVTSSNSSLYPTSASFYQALPDGSGGFVSVLACVNRAGYGSDGRVSVPCAKGSYNPADTYFNCTACPKFTTTSQRGTASQDGCNLCEPGYGGDKCLTQCGGVGLNAVSRSACDCAC